MKITLRGRAIGILIADGSDRATIEETKDGVGDAGAAVKIIAPRIDDAKLADGSMQTADGQVAETPSVLFDAVAVIFARVGTTHCALDSAAVNFARNSFGYLNAIAVEHDGQALVNAAKSIQDDGVVNASDLDGFIAAANTRQWEREKHVRALA